MIDGRLSDSSPRKKNLYVVFGDSSLRISIGREKSEERKKQKEAEIAVKEMEETRHRLGPVGVTASALLFDSIRRHIKLKPDDGDEREAVGILHEPHHHQATLRE